MSLIDQEVNLMDIESGSFLDVGFHNVYVFTMQEIQEQGKTPYIEMVFRNEQAQTHTARFYWTEKAMWRIKGLAIVCGIDPNDTRFTMRNLLDKWLTIELHKEEYDGKSLTKLKNVHPCKKEGLKTDDWDDDTQSGGSEKIPEQDINDPF